MLGPRADDCGAPEVHKTFPKPRMPKGVKLKPSDLAAGRYGTKEMVDLWGPEKTFEFSLRAQSEASLTFSLLHPDIVPPEHAAEIASKANLQCIKPERIRELEEQSGHDVIAINTALEEVLSAEDASEVSKAAASDVNKGRASADTTETARALQLKATLEEIVDSVENLRDILIEKAVDWIDVSHMDGSHGYDALPSVAGRALVHYVEMLQSGLELLKFVYYRSIKGKWGDATGNHHSATTLGADGMRLQSEYCKRLGIGCMIAPAQVPGREFDADVIYSISRMMETLNNIAIYVKNGRKSDVSVFVYNNPRKKKGSSSMPHKDMVGGNPVNEEQVKSARKYFAGILTTAMMNCEMEYARDLDNSANTRINFDNGFKFVDHAIRNLAETVFYIDLNKERCKARVLRTNGVVTAEQIMTYLTDRRFVGNPLGRKQAHDLMGGLATKAYNENRQFIDVLRENQEVASRIADDVLVRLTDPLPYIGQSREIIQTIAQLYHRKKTLVKV